MDTKLKLEEGMSYMNNDGCVVTIQRKIKLANGEAYEGMVSSTGEDGDVLCTPAYFTAEGKALTWDRAEDLKGYYLDKFKPGHSYKTIGGDRAMIIRYRPGQQYALLGDVECDGLWKCEEWELSGKAGRASYNNLTGEEWTEG